MSNDNDLVEVDKSLLDSCGCNSRPAFTGSNDKSRLDVGETVEVGQGRPRAHIKPPSTLERMFKKARQQRDRAKHLR